jgi:nucleotide-binding universal stress UspA family protein
LKKYQQLASKQLPGNIDTSRANGNAAEQILKAAEKKHASFIVIGSRGLSSAKEYFLGSVSLD